MRTYQIVVERMTEASHEKVYHIVTDMDEHRNILPKEFEKFDVLKGGKGEGTVFRAQMNVMGNRSTLEMTVFEPEKGRIIQEIDERAGVATTWRLTPSDSGRHCRIRLTSEFRSKRGFAGLMERLLVPPIIRSVYKRELEMINAYLTNTLQQN